MTGRHTAHPADAADPADAVHPGDVRVDAHLHVWKLPAQNPSDPAARRPYSWLTPGHGALFDTFTAEQARAELDAAGFDAAVLVQADDTIADTDYLLDVANRHPWVAGVVGWIPLDDPRAAESALDRVGPRLAGVRHLVHDDPRDDFLALPTVRESLGLLAERGLPFDVPDAWPRHLDAAADLAAALPSLTVVIDHLGKPPRGAHDFDDWHRSITRAAALPNVAAKVSGLRMPGLPFDAASLEPIWTTALDLFGADRLMYGGDWPMVVPDGGYQATWAVMSELIERLPGSEKTKILGGTATDIYRLGRNSIVAAEPDAYNER